MLRFDVITLFPEFFVLLRDLGITGRAYVNGLWALQTWNPRNYVFDAHKTVDDRPYGGGPGMVMLAQPLVDALLAARAQREDQAPVVLLAPGGKTFNQPMAASLSASSGAIFVCGRYEGIDQRFIDNYVDEQWSIGDFVLSGGELALVPMLDASIRLLPGAMAQQASHDQDSFQPSLSGLLDSPHYTRPEQFQGEAIPAVLKSGHHEKIALWRREQSLRITLQQRPDLIEKARQLGWLTPADEAFLVRLVSQDGFK